MNLPHTHDYSHALEYSVKKEYRRAITSGIATNKNLHTKFMLNALLRSFTVLRDSVSPAARAARWLQTVRGKEKMLQFPF